MSEETEALVEQYSETVQARDWDGLRELVTDDFVVHEPERMEPEPVDIEGHIESIKAFD